MIAATGIFTTPPETSSNKLGLSSRMSPAILTESGGNVENARDPRTSGKTPSANVDPPDPFRQAPPADEVADPRPGGRN